MKKLLLFCGTLLFFSCQKESNPIGHWHINNDNINEIILDINDSTTIINQHDIQSDYKIEKRHHKTNQINLWECGSGVFTYTIKGDKIYLHDFFDVSGHTLEGYRCEEDCCNKKKEIVQDLKVKMDLPEIKNKRTELNPQILKREDVSSLATMAIGKPKKEYQEFYGDKIQLQLNDKFGELRQIHFFVEEKKATLPDSLRNKIQHQLVLDKNIMLLEAKPVIDELLRLKIDSSKI